MDHKFKDRDDIPLAPSWGGFRIVPKMYEFWQGDFGNCNSLKH